MTPSNQSLNSFINAVSDPTHSVSHVTTVPAPTQPVSANPSPAPSPAASIDNVNSQNKSASQPPSSDPNFTSVNTTSDLQARFGTGPLPGLSSIPTSRTRNDTTAPPSPAISTAASSEQELWEYRDQLLTRSALSLVLRQEALAQADSSGQYAGEVSWDEIRNAWIPVWAEKLGKPDVAEGEVPDTNPAGFKVKRRDAWGNKVGWRNGIM
jgi:hypothetical protein